MKDFAEQRWIHNANLYWINGGKVMEQILSNVPYPVARAERLKRLHTKNYPGLLVVVSALEKDQRTAIDKEIAKQNKKKGQ